MKKIFVMLLAVMLIIPAFAQGDDARIKQLSDRMSKYLINNVVVHLKGIRFLETTGKLQRGLNLQYTVVLNKKGTVEDVLVVNGVNEIFDDDFRTAIFLMPKTVFEDITITGEKSYIPIILETKLSACDRRVADQIEDEYGRRGSKRWKRFNLAKETDLLKKFPELSKYQSVKDEYYCSLWYVYFRLMNLKITPIKPE